MLAVIVETKALWQTVVASLAAAVGVTFIFSVTIFGAAHFAELRRDDRPLAAAGAALVMVVGLVAFAAAIAVGIVVMTSK
jgi:cytochrome c biogenesis protein CcdA